jgi:uncharacterized protein (TIGR00255 family)
MSAQSPIRKPALARSMTGYARVRNSVDACEIVVSVKSVNHRSLDIHFQTSSELDPLEHDMRAVLRRRLIRGHIEVRVGLTRTGTVVGLALNKPLLHAYLAAFHEGASEAGVAGEPDLNAALRVPGMLGEGTEMDLPPNLCAGIVAALEQAIDGLDDFREREGQEIVEAMLTHNAGILEAGEELAEIRSRALPLYQARLNDRIRDLLKGASIDPQRLAQEAALLADRSDVAEEISRLKIHSTQLGQLLGGGGEIGKKLDFLLQEMNREANTILSKTTGIGELGLRITELALAAKAGIEKIREQSLNLE